MYYKKPYFPKLAQNGPKLGGCAFWNTLKGKSGFLSNNPINVSTQQQQGVALITAMIITTIAVSLAGMVMYRQQLQIRLSSNISHLEQAYLYVYGMEDWAGTILNNSFEDNDKKYVSLEDNWYADGNLITFPIDGGTLNGQLIDLQGRINVNALTWPKPPPPPRNVTPNANSNTNTNTNQSTGVTPSTPILPDIAQINRDRLENLLAKIDPQQNMGPVENFTDILKDWIDKDQKNGNVSARPSDGESGSGAESDYYQSLDPAYFSANTKMINTTELRLLKDMTKNVYIELKKYITALPIEKATTPNGKDIRTKLNVNTADKKVLSSLAGLTPEDAENIIERRDSEPFKTMNAFKQFAINLDEKELEDIDVTSNFFLLKGRVTIINASIPVNSILERKNGKISVIMRDFSVQ